MPDESRRAKRTQKIRDLEERIRDLEEQVEELRDRLKIAESEMKVMERENELLAELVERDIARVRAEKAAAVSQQAEKLDTA